MDLLPLVRIPAPDPFAATQVLDGGAGGVMVPYVETAEQVRALSGAVKLRPVKGQRLAERLAGRRFEPALEDYLARRNHSALVVNIESVPALNALDEILATPGLDGVLIGPHDLSCSLACRKSTSIRTSWPPARRSSAKPGPQAWVPGSTGGALSRST